MVPRVLLTEKAAELIARLKAQHGPLMFHQSGGCCDGSTPMCFAAGEFRVGAQDVLMGEIAGCNFYIGANQILAAYAAHHRCRAGTRRGFYAGSARGPSLGAGTSSLDCVSVNGTAYASIGAAARAVRLAHLGVQVGVRQ